MKTDHSLIKVASLIAVIAIVQLNFVSPLATEHATANAVTVQHLLAPSNLNFSSIQVSNSTLGSVLSSPPVYIDKALFFSSVPSSAEIGINYTVKVLVNNNSDEPIPVFFRVEAPIQVMYVHPDFVEALVPANGQVTGNFSVVPFNGSYKGMINVTAVLYIWFYNQMNHPQQVQQLSDVVFQIKPYPYSVVVTAFLALLVIIPVSVVVLSYRKFKRDRKASESSKSAS